MVGFIATPGALNIQPRIDGASDAIKQSGKSIKFTAVGTNADVTKGLSIIDAYAQGHPGPGRHAGGGRRLDPVGRPGGAEVRRCATRA